MQTRAEKRLVDKIVHHARGRREALADARDLVARDDHVARLLRRAADDEHRALADARERARAHAHRARAVLDPHAAAAERLERARAHVDARDAAERERGVGGNPARRVAEPVAWLRVEPGLEADGGVVGVDESDAPAEESVTAILSNYKKCLLPNSK